MSRLLPTTENSLKVQYYQTKHSIMQLIGKTEFTSLNEFEQNQLAQLEINLKRIKIKLMLKGVEV